MGSRGLKCKTSIAISFDNTAGALFKALSVFALRDIDLTKIESRPCKPDVMDRLERLYWGMSGNMSTTRPFIGEALARTANARSCASSPAARAETRRVACGTYTPPEACALSGDHAASKLRSSAAVPSEARGVMPAVPIAVQSQCRALGA